MRGIEIRKRKKKLLEPVPISVTSLSHSLFSIVCYVVVSSVFGCNQIGVISSSPEASKVPLDFTKYLRIVYFIYWLLTFLARFVH